MRKIPKQKVTANFEEDPGFEVLPFNANTAEAARPAQALDTEFSTLQEKLLENAFNHTETLSLFGAIRQAANEAAGLAWTTEFPLLVYPVLFDEKTLAFRKREQRQQQIMARSHALVEEVRA